MPENFEFGFHFGSIFGAKMDQKSLKNRSQNGCKMCMHFGIDFLSIFIDLGAQDGPPRGANEGPTNQLFRSEIQPGPPTRPKTAQDPPKTPPQDPPRPPQDPPRPFQEASWDRLFFHDFDLQLNGFLVEFWTPSWLSFRVVA